MIMEVVIAPRVHDLTSCGFLSLLTLQTKISVLLSLAFNPKVVGHSQSIYAIIYQLDKSLMFQIFKSLCSYFHCLLLIKVKPKVKYKVFFYGPLTNI